METSVPAHAAEAFAHFASHVLLPERAARYTALARNEKGQRKLLTLFDHDFEKSVRSNIKQKNVDRRLPCFAFHQTLGFGAAFTSIAQAYEMLDSLDGWLVVAADGSAGIFRPESRWDATAEYVCDAMR